MVITVQGNHSPYADPNEVWIMELIGKGTEMVTEGGKTYNKNKGAVWVAVRIPDGYVCGHANQARIRQFPLDDPENCLYAPDVIRFAREKGYYRRQLMKNSVFQTPMHQLISAVHVSVTSGFGPFSRISTMTWISISIM